MPNITSICVQPKCMSVPSPFHCADPEFMSCVSMAPLWFMAVPLPAATPLTYSTLTCKTGRFILHFNILSTCVLDSGCSKSLGTILDKKIVICGTVLSVLLVASQIKGDRDP